MRMSDLFKQFQLQCPDLVKDLEGNTHHFDRQNLNPYHVEGNTWAHISMVCLMTEVLKVNDVVKIACLLHDLGKPMSTQVDMEKRRVKMFGHEGLSLFLGINFLNTLEITHEQKIRVLELVSYHTFLYKAMRDETTFEKNVVDKFKGSAELLLDLIDMTACDALGRFTAGDEKRDFWMNAQSNLGHLAFKCDTPQYPRATKGEAIILVGPPMAGKSTWVKKNAQDYLVLSRDQVIMEMGKGKNYTDAYHAVDQDEVNANFAILQKEALKSGKNLVYDLTNMTEKDRRRSLSGIPKDMKRKAVVFLTDYKTLVARNEKRTQEEGKTIPQYVLKNMMGKFMMPLKSEGFDEIMYIFDKGKV